MKNAVHLSLSAAATEFAVSRDTMRRVLSEAGVAPSGSGPRGHDTYRLRDIVKAFARQQPPDQMNPHLRFAQARAILAEDEILLRRRELRSLRDIERAIGSLLDLDKRTALFLPDVLERDCGLSTRALEIMDKHLVKQLLERWHLVAEICQEFGLSKHLAARALPPGYAIRTDPHDDGDS
jgi:AraC-like DNA-binding protein